jgi:hypothetical protein
LVYHKYVYLILRITEIRKDDVVYKDNDNIMKQFINFYDDLFKAEDIDEHVMDFFLKDLPVHFFLLFLVSVWKKYLLGVSKL